MLAFKFVTREIERSVREIDRFCDDVPEIAGAELVRQVREFAGSSVAPDGTKWKLLSREYAKKVHRLNATKKVTGGFLASVKNREGLVYVDSVHEKIAQGLERLRVSFDVAPITPGNVERLLLNRWNEI